MANARVSIDRLPIGEISNLEITTKRQSINNEVLFHAPTEIRGSMELQMDDTSLYQRAKKAAGMVIEVDVTPLLDRWITHPLALAEEGVFGRSLHQWEKSRIMKAVVNIDMDGKRTDVLARMMLAIYDALALSKAGERRARKRDHLQQVRRLRQHMPPGVRSVDYRHEWVRTRCTRCRGLYATEVFITLVLEDGRRLPIVERESILDCGHSWAELSPVSWERRGYSPSFGARET